MHTLPSPTLEALESLDLPTPPATLMAFLQALGRGDSSMDELAELVRREPSLAARILTIANSAAFQDRGELRSIKQSLQVLGVRTLHSIAACLAVRETFAGLPGARSDDLDGFWCHSLLVAELAQAIARDSGCADPEEAYLGGLLHDLGELLLLGGLGDRYGSLLLEAGGAESGLLSAEQMALGTDHAAVGAWLIDRWQLPSLMADAVLFHHHQMDEVAQADELTRVVWTAHACQGLAAEASADAAGLEAAGQLVGLDSAVLLRLHGQAQASVSTIAAALGVVGGQATPTPLPLWRPAAAHTPADPQRDSLRDAVASMAALQPLQQDLASAGSEAQLLGAARQSARLLFGVREVIFMLRNDAGTALVALALPGQPAQLQKLPLMLHPPGSGSGSVSGSCIRAALEKRSCSSFALAAGHKAAVSDLQLARALGSEGLLCVPMTAGGAVLGVMVCAVSRLQSDQLQQRLPLLDGFGALLAGHLQSWRALRQRDRERQAAASDRLAQRDRQVAHEAGNPLSIIKSYLQIVRRKMPQDAQLGAELEVMNEELDRVARILRQLGEPPFESPSEPFSEPFSKRAPEPTSSAASELIDLNALVNSLQALYGEALFGSVGVKLVLTLQAPLALAHGNRDGLRQVLLNLWKNAAEALPAGAQVITATTDHVQRDGRLFTQLSVSDNGPGLPDDVMSSLFKPLGRQRRAGHSGLGLSIVHTLVVRMGGHLDWQSAPGRGTHFSVRLPQAFAGPQGTAPAETAPSAR